RGEKGAGTTRSSPLVCPAVLTQVKEKTWLFMIGSVKRVVQKILPSASRQTMISPRRRESTRTWRRERSPAPARGNVSSRGRLPSSWERTGTEAKVHGKHEDSRSVPRCDH